MSGKMCGIIFFFSVKLRLNNNAFKKKKSSHRGWSMYKNAMVLKVLIKINNFTSHSLHKYLINSKRATGEKDISNFRNITPVSYTHLDVYKRQLQH